MSKGHRDNHQARVKRGAVAFAKKAERRGKPVRPSCHGCGTRVRPGQLKGGFCPSCLSRVSTHQQQRTEP